MFSQCRLVSALVSALAIIPYMVLPFLPCWLINYRYPAIIPYMVLPFLPCCLINYRYTDIIPYMVLPFIPC